MTDVRKAKERFLELLSGDIAIYLGKPERDYHKNIGKDRNDELLKWKLPNGAILRGCFHVVDGTKTIAGGPAKDGKFAVCCQLYVENIATRHFAYIEEMECENWYWITDFDAECFKNLYNRYFSGNSTWCHRYHKFEHDVLLEWLKRCGDEAVDYAKKIDDLGNLILSMISRETQTPYKAQLRNMVETAVGKFKSDPIINFYLNSFLESSRTATPRSVGCAGSQRDSIMHLTNLVREIRDENWKKESKEERQNKLHEIIISE